MCVCVKRVGEREKKEGENKRLTRDLTQNANGIEIGLHADRSNRLIGVYQPARAPTNLCSSAIRQTKIELNMCNAKLSRGWERVKEKDWQESVGSSSGSGSTNSNLSGQSK